MKIVIYSHYFFPVCGGVQTYVSELASGLSEWADEQETGPVEVTVLTQTPSGPAGDGSWPFRLVRCPGLMQLTQELRSADIIHLAGPTLLPLVIGFLFRKPIAVEHHGYQAICPNGLLLCGPRRTACPGYFMQRRYGACLRCNSGEIGWLGSLRWLVLQFPRRWLCKLVARNLAITDHVAARIALPRTETVLYGIRDPGLVEPAERGGLFQIGYVGRLVREKGLPVLLEAAQRLKADGLAFHLNFVGDGPMRKELQAQAQGLGISREITFAGELTGADLDRAVRPLDVVVMPSVWEETAGLAAIEQMMRGRAVIASDIGGLSEVVGQAGLKFPPGDPEALYNRLRRALQDPAFTTSLGDAARERALKLFTRDKMIRAHVLLYRELAG